MYFVGKVEVFIKFDRGMSMPVLTYHMVQKICNYTAEQ
jgi:hypothetical protein